jgi:hypothetical protein
MIGSAAEKEETSQRSARVAVIFLKDHVNV